MPGYNVIAADGLKSGLVCPECDLVLKEAVQTPEGNRLCESCYQAIARQPNYKSKKTGISVVGEEGKPFCFPDKAVRREVQKLEVQCNNWKSGCKWVGQLGNYFKVHESDCSCRPTPCPDCGDLVTQKKLDHHRSEECRFRKDQCEYCGKKLVHHKMQDHHKSCKKYPRRCEYCQDEISRENPSQCIASEGNLAIVSFRQLSPVNETQQSEQAQDLYTTPCMESTGHVSLQRSMESNLQISRERHHSSCLGTFLGYMEGFAREVLLESNRQASQASSSQSYSDSELQRVGHLERKYEDVKRQVTMLKVHVSEMELQLQASQDSTYNGSFLWKIPDITKRKRDAIDGRVTSLYSPPFYTAKNGYKMCIRVYLNGDGIGHKTHFSLFFVLMKGEFDALVKWPFDYKVSLILVDQNHHKHIVQTFKPTPESSSFQRPVSDMNVASGCPQFCKLSYLDDENYTKDDVLFIKCIVDTSRIFHP